LHTVVPPVQFTAVKFENGSGFGGVDCSVGAFQLVPPNVKPKLDKSVVLAVAVICKTSGSPMGVVTDVDGETAHRHLCLLCLICLVLYKKVGALPFAGFLLCSLFADPRTPRTEWGSHLPRRAGAARTRPGVRRYFVNFHDVFGTNRRAAGPPHVRSVRLTVGATIAPAVAPVGR
jgi:hypothetical protein